MDQNKGCVNRQNGLHSHTFSVLSADASLADASQSLAL